MRSFILNLLVALLVLAVSLATLEIYFRYYDHRFLTNSERNGDGFHIEYPDADKYDWFWIKLAFADRYGTYRLETSEFSYDHIYIDGLRNEQIDTSDTSMIRILCLGDSFTEGNGAPQDSSWPAQLQQLLEYQNPGRRYNVFNAGFMGADPVFNYANYKYRYRSLNPDIVIQAWTDNDMVEVPLQGGLERLLPDTSVQFRIGPPDWIDQYERSFAFRAILHGILRYDGYLRSPRRLRQDIRFTIAVADSLNENYSKMAREDGGHYFAIFLPTVLDGVRNEFGYPLQTDQIRLVLPYIDQAKQEPNAPQPPYIWPADRHFNSRGYQLVAEAVYRLLAEDADMARKLRLQNAHQDTDTF